VISTETVSEPVLPEPVQPEPVLQPTHSSDTALFEELRQTDLFHALSDEELELLARRVRVFNVPADQYILHQDEPAEALFLIREGAVTVIHDAVGLPLHPLAHLRRGDFFGEMCLMDSAHVASVRSTEPCRLLRIPKEDLEEILRHRPTLEEELRRVATERFNARISAIVELGRRREVRVRFCRRLALLTGDGERRSVLESLSLGGIGLKHVPEPWSEGDLVRFGIEVRGQILRLQGRVAWRQGERAGIELEKVHPNHDAILQLLISWLREEIR